MPQRGVHTKPTDGPPQPPPVDTAPAGPTDHGEWDTVAQTELATRPMLQLPEAAALPHPLTERLLTELLARAVEPR